MKKATTLAVLILFFFSSFSQTPITLTSADMPVAPWSQKIRKDTLPLPVINFGNKGANQVYDFSNLSWVVQDTIEYRVPTSTQLSSVPGCDDAITNDGISFLFTKTTSTGSPKLSLFGFEGPVSGSILSAPYQTTPDIYHFPTQYGGTYSGNYSLTKTVPGSAVGQSGVNQVRLTITGNYTDTVDGYGKIITPVGAYKGLRIKRKDSQTTLLEYELIAGFGWANVPGYPKTANTVRYTYPTKEAKGNVVTFDYDSVNNVTAVSYSLILPNAPIAKFGYVIGSGGSVAFTDSSDNYPTSWAWTFGDGGSSTQQNPTHVYVANGTYTVCLTATNAGGSSTQVCKQVVISNAAVIPVAAFSWANPSGGLVNFTDLSTNNPTSWSWTFGDAGASAQQSPSHVYTANGIYNVCLTATNIAGGNTHCANVTVTGISTVNNAPVAANDTASVLQPNGLIRNVGTNDIDPNGDNFCITAVYGSSHFTIAATGNCTSVQYSPDSTFAGADSCYYIICDNGSPVKCDTGKFVVNSLYNAALLPVAGFSWHQTGGCQAGIFVNTSTNETGTVGWNFYSMNTQQNDIRSGDTVSYNDASAEVNQVIVTLTVSNQFGTNTFVDTVTFNCMGLNELSLSNIQLYPNPSSNNITIDMSRNQDEITRNYSAIEIYNALGEKVKLVSEKNLKVANISVADLTEGIYLATLVDAIGTRRTLGRFTISR